MNNLCLVVLAGVATTAALIFTRSILVPFVISIFIYALLSPVLQWQQSTLRLPRVLAILLTALVFLLLAAIIFYLVSSSLSSFMLSADIYRDKIVALVQQLGQFAGQWGIKLDSAAIQGALDKIPVLTMAQNITGSAISFVGNTMLVVVFVLFLITGDGSQQQPNRLFLEIQNNVSRYVATKFLVSLATGILVGAILGGFGVELALMLAVLTVLLNFIPTIGSLIATLLPVPVLLLQFGLAWQTAVVLGLLAAIQFMIGSVLEPKVMGESLDLHPVTILLFLMFWGLVWGFAGMFLAVPITAILKIILSRLEQTKPVAELLAGRLPA